MFTPVFRIFMALLLVVATGITVWAKAWLCVLVVGPCALFCVINIIKEIMDVSVPGETDQ
jgi:hypothetical protein